MGYIFKNTEINTEKASNFETKSLLYLIGMRKDSNDIEFITIDCFNDVSGIDKSYNKVWDIQSKNHKELTPKKIGESLFTLFDNFTSEFKFHEYILFTPKIKDTYKVDKDLKSYNLSNIVSKTLTRIKLGLSEEVTRVKGKSTDYSTRIENFINTVLIVEDGNSEVDYIKKITKFKDKCIKSDNFYESVFNDIRSIQTSKKNSLIENSTISEIREVLNFNRHLHRKHIEVLIINRIIGCEIFNYKSIPFNFFPFIQHLDHETVGDTIQECNSNLSRAFFNKNSNKIFWNVCERIVTHINSSSSKDVKLIHTRLFATSQPRTSHLNTVTLQYLISIILDGIS